MKHFLFFIMLLGICIFWGCAGDPDMTNGTCRIFVKRNGNVVCTHSTDEVKPEEVCYLLKKCGIEKNFRIYIAAEKNVDKEQLKIVISEMIKEGFFRFCFVDVAEREKPE